MILTLDLGTTVTKADVWAPTGRVSGGRAELVTRHPGPHRDEQDPTTWWPALLAACASARQADPEAWGDVDAIGLGGARQTIVLAAADGATSGPAILWSDRRAGAEATDLAVALGGAEAARQRTGLPLDGGAVAAKLAWLAAHEAERLADARWVLAPRDLVAWLLTGQVATDVTMASASGCYDREGGPVADLVGPRARLLPPVLAPTTVVGTLTPEAAGSLGLRDGLPVVIGAGDRACESLGAGSTPSRAAASWGTTANLSRPVPGRPEPVPTGLATTRAADEGGWLIEAGLAAAGSLLAWLADRRGTDVDALVRLAADSPPGARGVVVLPWLGGARAPWWRDDVDVEVVGVTEPHGTGDLARAALEGVARDLARCLTAMTTDDRPPIDALAATGRGAAEPLWLEILTATTGRPAVTRRSAGGRTGSAAVGAAVLAARGTGREWSVDRLDPVVAEIEPDLRLVERYAELGETADGAARAALDRTRPTGGAPTAEGPT